MEALTAGARTAFRFGEKRDALEVVGDDHDASVRQVALAWLLDTRR